MTNIAIIGAGLSGLTVATILNDYVDITVFEKARGVGGRMSTRRAEAFSFDHGAQFFKARTNEFKAFIAPMTKEGVISTWNARFVEIQNRKIKQEWQWDDDYPHYVGVPGMNAMAKYLSQTVKVEFGTRVETIKKNKHRRWSLENEYGNSLGDYDWVISTVPAEQASNLLPGSLLFFPKVKAVTMTCCFSLMLGFEYALPLEFDAALIRDENISWISVNSSKPHRNGKFCLLVHSTNNWADKHIDDDREAVMNYLCQHTSEVIRHDVLKADHKAIHGWRYANIEKQEGATHFIDSNEKVGVCGDWLIQGRVEAAFTSGLEFTYKFLEELHL